MELRQLEYFCSLGEQQNFTRTASALHVSQPSVTKAVKLLEAELGLTLVDRSHKNISLTEAGQAFLPHARRIMQDVAAAKEDMQRFGHAAKATIHFGIPPMIEGYLFPDFYAKFSAAYHDISLDVQEYGDSLEIKEDANNGVLDFGIMMGGEAKEADSELLIMTDHMSLCVSPQHRLAKASCVSFGELSQEKFIMQQPHTYQYRLVQSLCQAAGFAPEILLCTSQLKTIKQLVANKLGVSVLPDFVTRMETILCRKRLEPPIEVRVFLYWYADKTLSDVDRRFLAFVQDYTATAEFKRHFRQ